MYLFIISNFLFVSSLSIIFLRLDSFTFFGLDLVLLVILQWNDWNVVCMSLEISLASFVFHVSVHDKDLDPMITLKTRFKTPVRKIFPRFIVCRRLRTQGRCHKLLRLCWPLHMGSCCAHRRVWEENGHILGKKNPQSRKDRMYTWQKTARISCHNFETNVITAVVMECGMW